MKTIEALLSDLQRNEDIRVILINGKQVEGNIKKVCEDGFIILNKNDSLITGISGSMVGAWQVSSSKHNGLIQITYDEPGEDLVGPEDSVSSGPESGMSDISDQARYIPDKKTDPGCLFSNANAEQAQYLFLRKVQSATSEQVQCPVPEEDSHAIQNNGHHIPKKDQSEVPRETGVEMHGSIEGYGPFADVKRSLIADFKSDMITPSDIEWPGLIKELPKVLKLENNGDKKNWDSILSRSDNAIQNHNLRILDQFAEEMKQLGDKYPDEGVFYFNAGWLKLQVHDYPDASALFEEAFRRSGDSRYLFNAGCSRLLENCTSQATSYIGAYLCLNGLFQDEDAWKLFCKLAATTEQYGVFQKVLVIGLQRYKLMNKASEITSDTLRSLISSIIYTCEKCEYAQDMISDLLYYLVNEPDSLNLDTLLMSAEDPGFTSICLRDQVSELDRLINIHEQALNDSGISVSQAQSDDKKDHASGRTVSEELASDESERILSDGLRSGYIYRTIGPNKYGFLRDDEGNEYHFSYDSIMDDVGYIDSADEFNQIQVLFNAKTSTVVDAATKKTAYVIYSTKMLENIRKLAQYFSKERDYPHAILEMERLLSYDPGDEGAKKQKERWEQLYEKKHKIKIDNVNFQPETPGEWEALGNLYLEYKMYQEAAQAFDRSSNTRTSSSDYAQGYSFIKMKRYCEAIECLDRAIEKNPLYYEAFCARGVAHLRSGEYKDALKDFEEAITLRPDFVVAWKYKGMTLDYIERYSDSLRAYDMAMIFDPEDWITLSRISSVLIKLNNLTDAMRAIDKVLLNMPDHADSLFTRGYIFQKQKRYDQALKMIQKSLELKPDNIKALTKKAFVLANLGKKEEAISAISRALQLNRNNPETWYYRGVVYHYARDHDEAIRSYERSLGIKQGVERVSRCLSRAKEEMAAKLKTDNGDGMTPEQAIPDDGDGNPLRQNHVIGIAATEIVSPESSVVIDGCEHPFKHDTISYSIGIDVSDMEEERESGIGKSAEPGNGFGTGPDQDLTIEIEEMVEKNAQVQTGTSDDPDKSGHNGVEGGKSNSDDAGNKGGKLSTDKVEVNSGPDMNSGSQSGNDGEIKDLISQLNEQFSLI